jgi:hypothetical protein
VKHANVLNLCNKPVEHPDFARVIEEIGEKPDVDDRHLVSFYYFAQSGLQILAHADGEGTIQYVVSVIFFIDVPSVREGFVKQYCREFTRGITAADSLVEVKRKMGRAPADLYADVVPILHHDFPDHSVIFHFDEPDGRKLELVSPRAPKASLGQPSAAFSPA